MTGEKTPGKGTRGLRIMSPEEVAVRETEKKRLEEEAAKKEAERLAREKEVLADPRRAYRVTNQVVNTNKPAPRQGAAPVYEDKRAIDEAAESLLKAAPEGLTADELVGLPEDVLDKLENIRGWYDLDRGRMEMLVKTARKLTAEKAGLEEITKALEAQIKEIQGRNYIQDNARLTKEAEQANKDTAEEKRKGKRNTLVAIVSGLTVAAGVGLATYFGLRTNPETERARVEASVRAKYTKEYAGIKSKWEAEEKESDAKVNAGYEEQKKKLQAQIDEKQRTLDGMGPAVDARIKAREAELRGEYDAQLAAEKDSITKDMITKAAGLLKTEVDRINVENQRQIKASQDKDMQKYDDITNQRDAEKARAEKANEQLRTMTEKANRLEEIVQGRVTQKDENKPEVNSNTKVYTPPAQPGQVPSQEDKDEGYAWSYVMQHYSKDRKPTEDSSIIALTKEGDYLILDGKTRQIRTSKDGKPLIAANYTDAGKMIQGFVDAEEIRPVYPNGRRVYRETAYNPLSKNGIPLPLEISGAWDHANKTSYAILPTLNAITTTLNTLLIEGNLRNTVPTNALKHATDSVPVVRKMTRGLDKFTQGTSSSLIGGSDFNQSESSLIVGNKDARWYHTGALGWLTHSYSDADNFSYGNGYEGNAADKFFQGILDTYETIVKGASLGMIYKAPDLFSKENNKSTSTTTNSNGGTIGPGD